MIVRDDEYLDFKNVPESKGIPPILYRTAAVALAIIFLIGASVCLMSGYGHHWPADTTERVPLNSP
jgi:ABC-type phosphate transport system auxiliary subunit